MKRTLLLLCSAALLVPASQGVAWAEEKPTRGPFKPVTPKEKVMKGPMKAGMIEADGKMQKPGGEV